MFSKQNLVFALKCACEPVLWAATWLIVMYWGNLNELLGLGSLIVFVIFGSPIFAIYLYGSIRHQEQQLNTSAYEIALLAFSIGSIIFSYRHTLPADLNEVILFSGLARSLQLSTGKPVTHKNLNGKN